MHAELITEGAPGSAREIKIRFRHGIIKAVLLLFSAAFLSCTSFPEKISREKFTVEDANRAGFKTELAKTAVQPDGKIVVLAVINLRDDRNSHRLYLKVQRYLRDGKRDDSFRCDDFFYYNEIEDFSESFLVIDKNGDIYFPGILRDVDNHYGYRFRYNVFRLSSSGALTARYPVDTGGLYSSLLHNLVPVMRDGYLKGFYVTGEYMAFNRKGNIYTILKLTSECKPDPAFTPVRGIERVYEKIHPGLKAVTPDGGLVYALEYDYGHKEREKRGIKYAVKKIYGNGRVDMAFNRNIAVYLRDGSEVRSHSVDSRGRIAVSLRTGDNKRDRVNRILLFDKKGRRIPSFEFSEPSLVEKWGGVDSEYTDLVFLDDGGLYAVKMYIYEASLVRLDSKGKIDSTFAGEFMDKKIHYIYSLDQFNDEIYLQEKHLWRFNREGSVAALYKFCSGPDFKPNKTLFEKAYQGCTFGCMLTIVGIYELFGGKMRFMP